MNQQRPSIAPVGLTNDTDRFRPYLLTGERILWTGRPKQGILLSARDGLLIPISLMWGGFALFWNYSVWTMGNGDDGPDWFFKLWGLPFLAAGLYIIFGRFVHDRAIRKSLLYAVTDQRVLTLRCARSPKLTSLDIRRLPRLELSEQRDGTGTIAFEETGLMSQRMNGFGWWVPSLGSTAQFYRIDHPRATYELIRNNLHA